MAKRILSAAQMGALLEDLAEQVVAGMRLKKLAIVGIRRRGEVLARRLQEMLARHTGASVPLGSLDISLYRDDFSTLGAHPVIGGTEILFPVDGKEILLVDDVLSTGRTVRAALDQIIDFGRPGRVCLLVLIDRGRRELPIAPDFVGKRIPVGRTRMVEVRLTEIDGKDEVILVDT